jgi:exodeoxyribonuclease VII small subunit
MKKSQEGSYAENYAELEKILEGLEQGEVDVDQLSAAVKRAAELIESCQKKLKETEAEVKKVVEKFETSLDGADDEDDDEDEDA